MHLGEHETVRGRREVCKTRGRERNIIVMLRAVEGRFASRGAESLVRDQTSSTRCERCGSIGCGRWLGELVSWASVREVDARYFAHFPGLRCWEDSASAQRRLAPQELPNFEDVLLCPIEGLVPPARSPSISQLQQRAWLRNSRC